MKVEDHEGDGLQCCRLCRSLRWVQKEWGGHLHVQSRTQHFHAWTLSHWFKSFQNCLSHSDSMLLLNWPRLPSFGEIKENRWRQGTRHAVKGPFGPGGKGSALELKSVAAGLQACPKPGCSVRLTAFNTPTSVFANIQNKACKRLSGLVIQVRALTSCLLPLSIYSTAKCCCWRQ